MAAGSRTHLHVAAALAAMVCNGPAMASVTDVQPTGFVSETTLDVAATPDQLYVALITPAKWWNKAHSWSGDAANLTLDARAGGCFCEKVGAGTVEHARVMSALPGKLLRLDGALGPLQQDAIKGVLSWQIAPNGAQARLIVRYAVGGPGTMDLTRMAPLVDGVIAEQATRLKTFVEDHAKH